MIYELNFTEHQDEIGELRYQVFTRLLGWVTGDPNRQIELDELDFSAHHLGYLDVQTKRLDGYVRVIQGGTVGDLLLEQEAFSRLRPPGLVIDRTVGEVSRMCVRPGRADTNEPSDLEVYRLLVRATYDLSGSLGIKTLCATTNDVTGGLVNKVMLERLSFQVVAGPFEFIPGVSTYTLMLDLQQAVHVSFFRAFLRL